MLYSFDMADFEAGSFTATRHPDDRAVSGDWVCVAASDEEALELARQAAWAEWAAPEEREPLDFVVEFV